jgi:carbonic anhydrase/acetyltransferase-like protein (isoleucine patch superfamily)
VPTIADTAWVHPLAVVMGDVVLGEHVSIWPAAVLRGDTDRIEIGDESNVQDGTIIHVDNGVPTTIGRRVTIGHRAVVHGATVHDDVLIGMGAIILNRAVIGSGTIVAAGAVVREGTEIPPGSLAVGVPARVIRETTAAERERIAATVRSYLALQEEYRAGRR